jgi:histidinol-phosphate aminotransferase
VKQSYASTRDGSAAIVTAEIEDGQVNERLLASARRPDLLAVFRNLHGASQQRHLSAVQRRGERRRKRATTMTPLFEKGGGEFEGIKLLLCENPLPPIEEAITAAQTEVPRGNYYTEAYSAPLRRLIAQQLGVPERLIHINAGSELILRQLFDRFGQQVHLLTPTYALFPEIAQRYTETRLLPEKDFAFDLAGLAIPEGTTLAVIVNPNNPSGGTFDMGPLPDLLSRHTETRFLVDEAFIGLGGEPAAHLVPEHRNLLVTRTLSKAHSLAGFRVGYAVLPQPIADDLNSRNDAYPLARPSEAAAIATLQHEHKIRARTVQLRAWTRELAARLRALGLRTFPTETYFFLADFAPHNAAQVAEALKTRGILVKPLNDPMLGDGFMRVTTALPEDNDRFIEALKDLLKLGQAGLCRPH